MSKNKKIVAIVIFVLVLLCGLCFLSGCRSNDQSEMPTTSSSAKMYTEDVDVTVTKINKRMTVAGVRRYRVCISVHSDKYQFDDTITINQSGMIAPTCWKYKVGDTVKAQLCTWKNDSTGEIVKQRIGKIY